MGWGAFGRGAFGLGGFWDWGAFGLGGFLFGELLFGELLGGELMGGGLLEGSLCLPINLTYLLYKETFTFENTAPFLLWLCTAYTMYIIHIYV